MKSQQTDTDQQEVILAGDEIPEAKIHEVVTFQPAADWNNAMLGALKQALKSPDAPIERVKDLIAIQREIQRENAKLEFNAAMSRVQSRIVPVVKNKFNSQTSSWYSDLNEICNMITPIYSAEGFSVSYGTDLSPLEGYTRTNLTLAHVAGFEKVYPLDLPVDDKGIKGGENKTQIHGIKSSHSYARNMLLSMAFNIAQKNVDDDGNAAGGRGRNPDVKVISEAQHGRLVDLLSEKNLSPLWLAGKMRVDDLEQLDAARYHLAEKAIESAKAQASPPIR